MQICRAPKCAAEKALISISFISSTVRQLNMRTPIFLSRLPIHSNKANKEVDEVRLINLLQIESLPMNVDQVRKATRMMTVWPTLIKMSESCRSVLCKYNVVVLLFTFDGSFGNNHRIGDTARMKWFVHYTDLINLGR